MFNMIKYKKIISICLTGLFITTLTACNTLTRLSEIGQGPKNSEIINPTKRPNYRPVSMPMPNPKQINYKSNSLNTCTLFRAFFEFYLLVLNFTLIW